MDNKIIKNTIIETYKKEDDIFREIFMTNDTITSIIEEVIDSFLNRSIKLDGKGYSNIYGKVEDITTRMREALLSLPNQRIIGVETINGLVYDEEKIINEGYILNDGDDSILVEHTVLNLYLWDDKYTKIILYHIDLTSNIFNLKVLSNQDFLDNFNMGFYRNDIFILGENKTPIVGLYNYIEILKQGHKPECYFDEGYFCKFLKKTKGINNDIFPKVMISNPVFNYGLLKNYSIDNIILLDNKNFLFVNILDKLDEIENTKFPYFKYNKLPYSLIDTFEYNE